MDICCGVVVIIVLASICWMINEIRHAPLLDDNERPVGPSAETESYHRYLRGEELDPRD